MKLKLTVTLFFATMVAFSQTEFKEFSKDNYSISHPNNWKISTSSKANEFVILSEIEKNETFRENLNLVIQDVVGSNKTLESFAKMSENQIRTIPNSSIIESRFVDDETQPYHILVWRARMGPNEMQLKQQIYVKGEKGYTVSFTALTNSYNRFIKTADEIFNSFKLN